MSELLYKGMLENGHTRYNRAGWSLPIGTRPGKWMPKIDRLVMCESGYHVCTIDQLPMWIAPAIYVVEVRGEKVEDNKKSAWQQARLVRRLGGWGMAEMVEWAETCAGRVAHLRSDANAANARAAAAASASAAAANARAAAAAYAIERQWQVDLLRRMLNIEPEVA